MTQEQEAYFLQLVSYGLYPAQAARKAGFTRQAFTMRKKRDSEFLERFKQADASAEMGLLAHVIKAAPKDWRAALSIMERRWPSRWARPEARAKKEAKISASNDVRIWAEMVSMIPGRRAVEVPAVAIDPETLDPPDAASADDHDRQEPS